MSTRTRTFYQKGETPPAEPTGNAAAAFGAYSSPGSGWAAADPGATATEGVYQVTLTQYFDDASTQDGSTFDRNEWGAVILHELPTGVSTRTRTFYQKGETAPAAPEGTAVDAYDLPGDGWAAADPGATATEGVYEVTLTQYLNDVSTQDGGDTEYRPLAFQDAGLTEVRAVALGSYQVRARYVALDGAIRSGWTESGIVIVAGFAPLAAPAGVAVEAAVGGYSVSWTPAPEPDYDYTEILDRVAGNENAVAAERGRSTGTPAAILGLNVVERLVSIRHVDRAGRKTAASAEASVTPTVPERGNPGRDGVDGQGREEAYALTAADEAPALPSNGIGFDSLPMAPEAAAADTWYDNRPTTTPDLPHAWHTIRGVAGVPAQGDSPYVDPDGDPLVLKAGWTNWFDARDAGRYAEDGQGREDAFILLADDTTEPALPSNALGFDSLPKPPAVPLADTWYDDQPPPTEQHPVVRHSLRGVAGTPVVGASPYVDPAAETPVLKQGWTNWLDSKVVNRWIKGDGLEEGVDRGEYDPAGDYDLNDVVGRRETLVWSIPVRPGQSPPPGRTLNADGKTYTFRLPVTQRYRAI